MINKKIFEKPSLKYGVVGIILGILIIFFTWFVRLTNSDIGLNIILALMYIPTEILSFFRPCPSSGFGCLYYGVNFALFTAPIYLGLLGFFIGYLVEKIQKKKKNGKKK
jgi:hypothetical protein